MIIVPPAGCKPAPPQKPKSPHQAELSAAAGILHALLVRHPRSWCELTQAGFTMQNLPPAITELEQAGYVIQVSPELVELQEPARAAS
jgi:hypothetical protein